MKKMILFLFILGTFTSCTIKTVTQTNIDTKLPTGIVQSLRDTSFIPNTLLVESGDQIYIIKQNAVTKQTYVDSIVDKSFDLSAFWIVIIVLVFILILVFITNAPY